MRSRPSARRATIWACQILSNRVWGMALPLAVCTLWRIVRRCNLEASWARRPSKASGPDLPPALLVRPLFRATDAASTMKKIPGLCPGDSWTRASAWAALNQPDVLQRQLAHELAGCGINGVEHRGRHHGDGRLADAAPEIVTRHDDRLYLRHLGEPHDLVAVEVQVDHPPILDLAFTVERGGQAIGHGAFDLRRDLARIDGMAAIERQYHAVNLELAAVADRDLGDGGRIAAVAHELRDAAMDPGRQRLAPIAFLRRGVEHGEVLGMLAHERAAELERVLAGRPRHFIHKAFHVDGVLIGVDAAPGTDRHMRVTHDVFDQQARHGVAELRVTGLLVKSLQLADVLAVDDAGRIQGGVDRLAGHAHVQADQVAARIKPGGEPALRDRPVEIVRLVLLAAPDQLDRDSRELLRDRHRLVDVILRTAAPAETAAEVHLVDLTLGERHAGGFRQRGKRCFRVLRRHPHLGFVGREFHRGVHGLHGGVSEEGRAVDRLDFFGRGLDRFARVAILAFAIGVGRGEPFLQVLGDRGARRGGAWPLIPNDGEGVERGFGPPPGIGNDRDRGVFHLHDLAHAGPARDLGFVVARQLAAEYRAILDRGAQHVRQLDVDSKSLAAVELVGGIEPFQRLAGDLPVFRIHELDSLGVRRLELGGAGSELAVAERTPRRGVGDDAVSDRQFADRHLPLHGRGLQQHHARGGAAAANVVLRGPDTAAAAGRHLAPDALAGEVLPRRDLFRLYLVPIALELFGDELDEPRDRALSHLRARDTDHAGVVGFDENPRIDLGAFSGALRNGGTEARRQIESECEPTARGGGADDERPARKLRGFAADRLFHGRPP